MALPERSSLSQVEQARCRFGTPMGEGDPVARLCLVSDKERNRNWDVAWEYHRLGHAGWAFRSGMW